MKVKNIIFDMGGVLINFDRQRCVNRFKELGFKDIEKYIDPYAQEDFFSELETGHISTEEFLSHARQHCKKDISDQQIIEAWNSFLLDIPKSKLDQIADLSKRFNVYLLSNTNDIHFPMINEKYHLDQYFDKCYTSYTMHYAKPDPRIFIHMLKDAGIKADESLFIDDSPANIAAASNLGFRTYLAKEKEDFSQLFLTLQPL